jgi:hypothetical protein
MARKRKKDQQKLGKPAKKKPADDIVTGGDGLVTSLVNKLTSFVTGRGRYVVSNQRGCGSESSDPNVSLTDPDADPYQNL